MIELKNISKIYDTGKVQVKALHNINLKISAGEFVTIMGPSGSGKSSLLNMLAFLDKPTSGAYSLFGRDISDLDEDQFSRLRNHLAGFVFQQFHLLQRMSALENTELPLIYAGKKDQKQAAINRIKSVGLSHRIEHYPNEMSGGEQQRVAIARSLVNDPFIIFADEPTGNLDSKSGDEIISILKNLNKEGKTIIMVTHEPELAKISERVIYVRDGEIVSDKKTGKKNKKDIIQEKKIPVNEILKESRSSFGRAEFIDYLRQAINSIISHKLRSILSMLGILIGVAAVISMLAIGQGAQESIAQNLSSLGSNVLSVRPGSRKTHGVALEAGAITRFTVTDAKDISKLNEISGVSPIVRGSAQLVYSNKNWSSQVQGVGIQYEKIRTSSPTIGRFFNEIELRSRKKLALVGLTIVKELFNNENPVGKTFKINRINFVIIGVLPEKGGSPWRDNDDIVLVPITTAMYRLLGKEYVDYIDVEVKDQSLINSAIDSIKELIIKKHRLTGNRVDTFEIMDMSEIRDALTSTTKTMGWLLGSVAAISLIVGGIGIMNIMLVTVKERTKEIGLRKSIGARRKDILTQFLIESALLTFSGGLTGILLGSGISAILAMLAGWAVRVSLFSIILSTVFSIIVGVLFGLWPAIQASRLNPIDALRYE